MSEQQEKLGRDAAEKLCKSWPDATWIPEQPTQLWAQGAVKQLAEIILQQPPIIRASQHGAEVGAGMLSPRPFQGLSESLQNADDLGASELRVLLRHHPRRDLLLIHNGEPVSLAHVGAMVFPWLSTKVGDEQSSGRFGIGQKTLKALGGPLEMHSAPFHFRMSDDAPEWVNPAPEIPGFYQPDARDTMLVVPLNQEIQDIQLYEAIDSLGVESLMFLRHILSLSFVDLDATENNRTFSIRTERVREIQLHVGEKLRDIKHDTIRIELPIDSSDIRFERYWMEQPVPPQSVRRNKKTGKFTPLGICVCSDQNRTGRFYDRIPLPIKIHAPVSLNAQFDPDGARSTILNVPWNAERLDDLGRFLGAVAIYAFGRNPSSAWMHVPLEREQVEAEGWIQEKYTEAVIEVCQTTLIDDLRLRTRRGPVPLSEIVYGDENIEALMTTADMELLSTDHSALLSDCKDEFGRWRKVLDDLNQSRLLVLADALQLFDHSDQIDGRAPGWFVEMAALAIKNELWPKFRQKKALLLADGRIVACPGKRSTRVLVRNDSPKSLARRLRLALPLHQAYTTDSSSAERVIAKLSELNILHESCDQPLDALHLLARSGEPAEEPVKVEDDDLLAIRSAWAKLDRDEQRDLGVKIGANIALRTIMYPDRYKNPVGSWDRPCDAYLPSTIDRETNSFASAAKRTSGLIWIDPRYAKLLKQEHGSSEAGPQRFLVALGVSSAPRLIVPPNEEPKWFRDSRPASAVAGINRPDVQLQTIQEEGYDEFYLLNDRWCPDLELVVKDIQSDPAKTKRKRALALLAVLNRGWKRRYADHRMAKVVVGSYGYWMEKREVQATWLARLASTAWLPNGNGALKPPGKLALRTDASRLAYGLDRSVYLDKINETQMRSDFLKALGIQLGPSVDNLVSKLQDLRDKPVTSQVTDQANTIYRLLAADLQGNVADKKAAKRLQKTFRAPPKQNGLLLVDGQWYSPEAVLRGPRVFGDHRAFAPYAKDLEPLWQALKIPDPTAKDCVDVLRILARNPSLSSTDQGVMIKTLQTLATLINDTSTQFKTALRRLPLWTGKSWSKARPMYVLDGEAIAWENVPNLNVWRPGFSSFSDVRPLFPIFDLVHLRLEDFVSRTSSIANVVNEEKRRNFAVAVELLKDELIRNDMKLHDSISCDWNELIRAHFIVDPELEITVQRKDSPPIRLPALSHMRREPLTFIVRSMQGAEASEAGGQAIASLFTGDRQKLAWAWTSVWRRAGTREEVNQIILPSTKPQQVNTGVRLADLKAQSENRPIKKPKSPKPDIHKLSTQPKLATQVRQLRDIEKLAPTAGIIVNSGAEKKGVVFVTPRRKKPGIRTFAAHKDETHPPQKSPPAVLPTTDEREQLAFEVVKRALRLDSCQIRNLRKNRGFGVDAIDELRQCYEIKMNSSATFPNDVTLTPNELEAAQNDPDFFLAVVAGLEAGDGNLKVRFIFNPLEQLASKILGNVTLTGIHQAEALEYEFSAGVTTENKK